jgi:hypothetical protein
MQNASFGERGHCNCSLNFGNHTYQDPNILVEQIELKSKHNMLKHSLLQHDGKESKDITRLKSENTIVQQCYNAAALHETCSKADYSNHLEGNTLGSQPFLLSWPGNLVAH